MISIGEFSKICQVTTKTLRYYDEIGLIKPMHKGESGYRYYAISQLKTMLYINRLKNFGLSLQDIAGLLKEDTDDALLMLLHQRKREMQEKMKADRLLLEKLEKDMVNLERGIHIMDFMNNYQVKLVELEPMNILFKRQNMSTEEYGKYIGTLFERIAKDHLTVCGNVMSIYHSKEFNQQNSDIEVAVPVKEPVKGTRDLPGGLHAYIHYQGAYSDIGTAHAKLTEWMEQEGYEPTGAPFEIYQNQPQGDPSEQITEVYRPVRKR